MLLMGAVAYDPKVVTIWTGFRAWLAARGFAFDFVLYSNYERQVEDLALGRIHAAWNSPLAWVRARRLAEARGRRVRPLVMRDTDRDLTSVIVVRADSPCTSVADLDGAPVAVGAVDSPQATLLPLSYLRAHGADVDVRRFDVGVGLHGDHVGGERDAAAALASGEVAAACMVDANHLLFGAEGVLPAGGTRVLAQTPLYDHCNLTVSDSLPDRAAERFAGLLLSMSFADPDARPLLDLEGLKSWEDGRDGGYAALERAVDETGFYDRDGRVTARGYTP
ncbi:phosphate/phosphite/phosphonate ABC transporter substrate-binding protein [Actinomadura algeriensis]|uniref:ABC-type phosphate/phosphonate transport system substrate-binding protein n=1 Tax=Actinomadura algeriensis TaxID=1679523 RepID=A0ABR9K4N8_9ACTN|nr:PhnD/SsuA/transferrin family substrate-binding protein [Actinomadura algeriensis]MBE1537584.1 ABC-type phosphate/phosphonate transport system substrate-binding protein [Actinomadura algeriensis]